MDARTGALGVRMKKVICILFTLTVLLVSAFADKSRFYEDGKIIDTMYVDSEDGLKVRDYPSLKSNRLCGLTHRLPVKIVAVGKEETIDGITAPWVEILIPRYEWKSTEPEYGWVFGGYIQNNQAEFKAPKTAKQLEEYLKRANWTLPDKNTYSGHPNYNPDNHFNFYTSQYYNYVYSKTKNFVDSDRAWFFQNYDDDDNQSTWKALNNHQIEIHWYIPNSSTKHNDPIDKVVILEIKPVSDGVCYINGTKYLNKPFVNRHHWSVYDAVKMPLIYNKEAFPDNNSKTDIISAINKSLMFYSEETYLLDDLRAELIRELIKYGFHAEGDIYEFEYKQYWDPIISKHQKKADAMK